MKKRLFSLFVAMAMLCTTQETVQASDTKEIRSIPVSAYYDENLQIAPIRQNGLILQKDSLESAYVSPYITSVKDQSPYGTCWAFAYIAASEASIIREGLAEKANLDLSEWQLAYFLNHSVADPLGGTTGDSVKVGSDYLNAGGNQELAIYRVANWYGLVEESVAPYSDLVTMQGNATLADTAAYDKDIVHLENAYWISMQDTEVVKQMIKEYGACGTAYYSADAYYSTGKELNWNTEQEVAVYCPNVLEANHGVTIVGWDDSYSKDNFGKLKPESDGAWYCKNSWGNEWSKAGYFWLSYEDATLLDGTAFFYDYAGADNYDHNYQYDGGAWSGTSYICNHSANIYTSQQDEYLEAVGVYTRNSNYNCTVKIYKLIDGKNPTNGELVAEQTLNSPYAGFHTIKLDTPVSLDKGDKFSVVVNQTDANGNAVRIAIDADYNDGNVVNTSIAEAGQSFVMQTGNTWVDISSTKRNCRIKAYTTDRIAVTNLELSQNELILFRDDTAELNAIITPSNATNSDVTWVSSDPDIVSVDESGKLTALQGGKVTITCISNDNAEIRAQCNIMVRQPVTGVRLDYVSNELIVGEVLQLNAKVLPSDANNKEVLWETSDESIATVSPTGEVTALTTGNVTITCKSTERDECIATCKIHIYERMADISFKEHEVTMKIGNTMQLEASTTPQLGKTKGVYWLSSDESIVSVDGDGCITALATGNDVEIHCIAKDGTGVRAVCLVDVVKPVETVTLQTSSLVLNPGDTYTMLSQVSPSDATNKEVSWMTSNAGVVSVTETGVVTAVGMGNAKITCIAKDGSQQYATCNISVVEKVIPYSAGKELMDTDSSIRYTVTKGGVDGATLKLMDGSLCAGEVVIPETVHIDGVTYRVTAIGANAFQNNDNIIKVVMPNDIISIEASAFYDCDNLTTVIFSENVTAIGAKAFYSCDDLTAVTFDEGLQAIGNKAFYNCKQLTKVIIPSKVNKIGNNAFRNCKKLKKIVIQTKKLTKKNVGKNSFKGIHAKAKIKVPKKKLKVYKTMLRSKGIGKRVKIKK